MVRVADFSGGNSSSKSRSLSRSVGSSGSLSLPLARKELARKELGGESSLSTGQWLRQLADALDEPAEERPWYKSKVVLAIVSLAAFFVGFHVLLLVRVLQKVHIADNRVLLYPIAGLGTAGVVGAFAIGVHKLSGPDTPAPKKSNKD